MATLKGFVNGYPDAAFMGIPILGATILLGTHGLYAQQMILLCALPSATIPAMFANQTGAYQSEAATSILVSTVLSIVTFSAAIYLIDGGIAAV